MPRISNRELIELELASLIQKLSYLRGDGTTPRTFPAEEYAAIETFGLACCRRMAVALENENPSFDSERTEPSQKFSKPKPEKPDET